MSALFTTTSTPLSFTAEVLATVTAHPSSAPSETSPWSVGRLLGTWKEGAGVVAVTVVESRAGVPAGAVHGMVAAVVDDPDTRASVSCHTRG